MRVSSILIKIIRYFDIQYFYIAIEIKLLNSVAQIAFTIYDSTRPSLRPYNFWLANYVHRFEIMNNSSLLFTIKKNTFIYRKSPNPIIRIYNNIKNVQWHCSSIITNWLSTPYHMYSFFSTGSFAFSKHHLTRYGLQSIRVLLDEWRFIYFPCHRALSAKYSLFRTGTL